MTEHEHHVMEAAAEASSYATDQRRADYRAAVAKLAREGGEVTCEGCFAPLAMDSGEGRLGPYAVPYCGEECEEKAYFV